ncbi:hypothetical protein RND81_05G001800 [Saponaria officinalis]|uniref:DNA glycosylase n=1 Tax=Saponaria officinalis TaxID=3572 RepID=A0AAW1KS66_SAPOF
MELKIPVEESFKLEKAVCNYGFFMMCPNQWQSDTATLRRPLRLADGSSSVMASISQPFSKTYILIYLHNVDSLPVPDQEAIQRQVIRMLRISEKDNKEVKKFQDMHVQAKSTGFGRLFRSPELFEDIVKTILLCNTTWQRTLKMSQALCDLQAELFSVKHDDSWVALDSQLTLADFFRKRKHNSTLKQSERNPTMTTCSEGKTPLMDFKSVRNFPTAKELAGLSENYLKTRCNLGYRAKYIIDLAQMVEKHELRLEEFEIKSSNETLSQNSLRKLEKLKGIGQFSAANINMCLGYYHHIPIDSETINHLRKVHGKKDCTKKTVKRDVKQVYDKFAPYQCLAYWYEHCEYYENELGKEMGKMSPSSYHKVSGSYLSKNNIS